jgi:hypothetical protein
MKLIVKKQSADNYYKNKFIITLDFMAFDESFQEYLKIYIDSYRYNNEVAYTNEVHNLIEALDEVVGEYDNICNEFKYGDSIEDYYSEFKIIKFIKYYKYNNSDKTLFNDLEIDIPINQFTDISMPIFGYEIKYNDNEGISFDVEVDN